jgi:chromosome segregation ATPase
MEEIKPLRKYIESVDKKVDVIHGEVKEHSKKDDASHGELQSELVEVKINVARLEARIENIEAGQKDMKEFLIKMDEKITQNRITDATLMTKVSGISILVTAIATGAINYLFFGN